METTEKNLDYYRKNAEENYLTTPISVLRYISELEAALRQPLVIKSVCDDCTAYPFDERGKTPLCKTCKDNPSQTVL